MATAVKIPNSNYWSQLVDANTGESINFEEVIEWYDGSPMDDSKVDGVIYRKQPPEAGGLYVKKVLSPYGESLIKKTFNDLLTTSETEILLLRMGYYKDISLLSYYNEGDTPYPVSYKLSLSGAADNYGGIVEIHGFNLKATLDIIYLINFGVNDLASDKQDRIDAAFSFGLDEGIVNIINNKSFSISLSDTNSRYNGVFNIYDNLVFENQSTIEVEPTDKEEYSVISSANKHNFTIYPGTLIGDRGGHLGVTGESGMGVSIYGGSNFKIEGGSISNMWGDGVYIGGGASINNTPQNFIITNIFIDNCRRQGISMTSGFDWVISKCYISNINGTLPAAGIDIEPNTNLNVARGTVENCSFLNNEGASLRIQGTSSGCSIKDIIVRGNNCVGGQLDVHSSTSSGASVTNVTFSDNHVYIYDGKVSNGIVTSKGTENIYIKNNIVYFAGSDTRFAIRVYDNVINCNIINNTVFNMVDNASIYNDNTTSRVTATNNIVIGGNQGISNCSIVTGNIIMDQTGVGISLFVPNIIVKDNIVQNTGGEGIIYSQTGGVIQNNYLYNVCQDGDATAAVFIRLGGNAASCVCNNNILVSTERTSRWGIYANNTAGGNIVINNVIEQGFTSKISAGHNTRYLDSTGIPATTNITTPDASDLGTVQTLANDIKAKVNELLDKNRNNGFIAP